jgi:hypothetical protein
MAPPRAALLLLVSLLCFVGLSNPVGSEPLGPCPRTVRTSRWNVTESDLQTSLALLQQARAAWEAVSDSGEVRDAAQVQEVVRPVCAALLRLPAYARAFALGVAFRAEGDAIEAVRLLKTAHRAAPGFAPPLLLLEELLDLPLARARGGEQLRGLIPAEILDDQFGAALRRLAAHPAVGAILEVGSSGGAGSTAALLAGVARRPRGAAARVVLHCVEASSPRVARLRERLQAEPLLGGRPVVRIHHAAAVPLARCATAADLGAFAARRGAEALAPAARVAFDRLWGAGALAALAAGAEARVRGEQQFLREAGVDPAAPGAIAAARAALAAHRARGGAEVDAGAEVDTDRFDLALLDGSVPSPAAPPPRRPAAPPRAVRARPAIVRKRPGLRAAQDLCGAAELDAVWGANVVALDDALGLKHLASRARLLASAEYALLEEDAGTRNGFAIFVRSAWPHAGALQAGWAHARAADPDDPAGAAGAGARAGAAEATAPRGVIVFLTSGVGAPNPRPVSSTTCRGTQRVRLVRGEGRGVST